jgi:hypothetical protein
MRGPSIDELRTEFIQNDVRGWIWTWLMSSLAAYVRLRIQGRYRESIYSPTGKWDDAAVSDIVNDFIVDRVIKKEVLSRALRLADNTAGVVNYLERALHNYIVDEREQSISGNIYNRLVTALSEDPELRRLGGTSGRAVFGLEAWSNSVEPLTLEHISEAMRHFPSSVKWREYQTGDRQSPGLFNEDLRLIAREVASGTGRSVTPSILMQIIRHRFNFGLSQNSSAEPLEVLGSHPIADPSPLEDAVAEDLASRAIERLRPLERRILLLMTQDSPVPTVRDLAAQLGISKSLVSRHQQNIAATFRALHISGEDERGQVIHAAGRLLAG